MNESRYSSLTTVARVEPEIFSAADVDVVAAIAAAPNNKLGAAAAITGALYKYVTLKKLVPISQAVSTLNTI